MKDSDMKKIIDESRSKNINDIIGNDVVTSKDACIAVSCNPSHKLLREILNERHSEHLYEKAHASLVEIEKKLHRLNKNATYQVKVASALYLSSDMYTSECAELLHVQPYSIRNFLKKIHMHKNIDNLSRL